MSDDQNGKDKPYDWEQEAEWMTESDRVHDTYGTYEASPNYVISKDGTLTELVPPGTSTDPISTKEIVSDPVRVLQMLGMSVDDLVKKWAIKKISEPDLDPSKIASVEIVDRDAWGESLNVCVLPVEGQFAWYGENERGNLDVAALIKEVLSA